MNNYFKLLNNLVYKTDFASPFNHHFISRIQIVKYIMKLAIYFFYIFLSIIAADSVDVDVRVQHGNRRIKPLASKPTSHAKSTRYNKRKMKTMIRKNTMKQICSFNTCAKCNKMVNVYNGVASKFCTLIINLPNCCDTEHMLLTRF